MTAAPQNQTTNDDELPEHIHAQIETIASHEQDFLTQRTRLEKLGDSIGAFAGSLAFVVFHVTFFVLWILINTTRVASIPHYDPFPFSLLGTVVAIEGLMLASFILMRQTRLARRSDERDHLILQILILTEREITATLRIQLQLAARLGLDDVAKDKTSEALSQHTSIDNVAQTIKQSLIVE